MSKVEVGDDKNKDLIVDAIYRSVKAKLIDAGYNTPRELAFPTISNISKKLGIDIKEAEKHSSWAIHKLEQLRIIQPSLSSAYDICYSKEDQPKLSTSSKELDKILAGGIERGALTQFYGSSGSGKTQLCYTLSVIIQQEATKGGLAGKAIYIDTENKFSTERIQEIAKARGFDIERILKNIIVINAISSTHQMEHIENIPHFLETDCKIKLVIVDSIINHYRQEFCGRQNLPERQSRLEKCVRLLVKLAQLYGIAVVITNQVSSLTDSFYRYPTVAAGGNALAHASKHTIYLKRIGESVHSKVVCSASLPRNECRIAINECGLTDVIY